MSGKSAKCVTMSDKLDVQAKMIKNTPNVRQLAGKVCYLSGEVGNLQIAHFLDSHL